PYEQSVVRRLNRAGSPSVFRPGPAGHPFIDIAQFDTTMKQVRTYQVFAGGSARRALVKALLSDRLADRTIMPTDVFEQINQAVRECEAVHSRVTSGQVSREEGNRRIRRLARHIGLDHVPDPGR